MATIQSSGLGLGTDISSLVSQLVAAERKPLDARITREQTSANTQISALGSLKCSMSYLRDAMAGLRTTSAFALRTATSSNKDVFTATATQEVPAGSYDVEVVALATAQKLTSQAFEVRPLIAISDDQQSHVGKGMFQNRNCPDQ